MQDTAQPITRGTEGEPASSRVWGEMIRQSDGSLGEDSGRGALTHPLAA